MLFDAMPLDKDSLIGLHGRPGRCPEPGNMTIFSGLKPVAQKDFSCTPIKKFFMHMVRFFLLFMMVPLSN